VTCGASSSSLERVVRLVRQVVPWQFAKREIGADADLQGDLGMDSLGKVALALRIEQDFRIDLSTLQTDLTSIRTVAVVVGVVDAMTGAGGGHDRM
jgi:acyl carrier protein